MADEATPTEAPRQPEQDTRPDWLEGNFNSVEDQARAYTEARSRMAEAIRDAESARAYAETVAEQQAEYEAQQQATNQPQLPFNPLVAQLEQAREMGDTQTELALQAYVFSNLIDQKLAEAQKNEKPAGPDTTQNEMYALMADNLARDRFEGKYGVAWDDIRQEAGELLQANPDMIPDTLTPTQAAERMIFAAEFVMGQKALAGQEQVTNQQQQRRQQHLMARTLQGAGAPPPQVDEQEAKWEAIKNAQLSSYGALRNNRN